MRSVITIISRRWRALMGILLVVGRIVQAYAAAPPPTQEQIESDWLRQDEVRGLQGKVTPEADAIGAVDGVKNGKWGFHTALEDNPWWQVDLGEAPRLDRMKIFNRAARPAVWSQRL